MRISASKIIKQNELVVILVLTNQKQSQVENGSLTVDPPSNVKVTSQDQGSELTWKGELKGFGNVCIHYMES